MKIGRDKGTDGRGTALSPRAVRVEVLNLDQARLRLANLPAGFTDWIGAAPAWPADVPEIIGQRAGEAG